MRVCSRLADNLIIDRDKSRAALAIPEESASPISTITAVCVTAKGVAVVDELKVLLATLLVAWH